MNNENKITSEDLNLTAGDKDNSESFIIIMLSKEELKEAAQEIGVDVPTDEDGWKELARDVGSAVWNNWTI